MKKLIVVAVICILTACGGAELSEDNLKDKPVNPLCIENPKYCE